MKRFIFNIIFILYIKVSAQHIISVIDDATREPIWHASFIYKSDTIAYTSPQGIALVPNKTGLIRIICNDYKSIEFDCDSIPSVVHLKSEVVKIDEIEVHFNET